MTDTKTQTLVVLSPAFPQDESDSVWVPPKQLFVKRLQAQYPSLHIIVLSFNYPHQTDTYEWNHVTVLSFNGMKCRRWKRLQLWRHVWNTLGQLKKEHALIGVLSFWCGECALVGRYFAKRHRLPFFCWISGMDAKKENKLVRWIRPRPQELVAMSAFLVKTFQANHGIKPQHLIPPGIDPTEFEAPTGIRDIDIIGVGSLSPFKRYELFVQVVKAIKQVNPGVRAVLCGDGVDREKLTAQINAAGLAQHIELVGMQSHGETLKWLQRSRIMLHPSAYEGFGVACLEALYAGAYVVSFSDPMGLRLNQWRVVKDLDEMTATVQALLKAPMNNMPVLLYKMDDTVKAMKALFNGSPLHPGAGASMQHS